MGKGPQMFRNGPTFVIYFKIDKLVISLMILKLQVMCQMVLTLLLQLQKQALESTDLLAGIPNPAAWATRSFLSHIIPRGDETGRVMSILRYICAIASEIFVFFHVFITIINIIQGYTTKDIRPVRSGCSVLTHSFYCHLVAM